MKKSMEQKDFIKKNTKYIVRTYSAGVFYGKIKSRNGKEVVMIDSRRLWYWNGAASLSELAVKGVSKPKECKFPTPVSLTLLTEAIEILECSNAASISIDNVPIWTAF